MKNEIQKTPPRSDFYAALTSGMEGIQLAGEILAARSDANPNEYVEIVKERPQLSLDVLYTLDRVGRGQLLPELAIDLSPGAKRLATLPVHQQRALKDAVPVVTYDKGKKIVADVAPQKMTPAQVKLAFDGKRLRTTSEQAAILDAGNQPTGRSQDRYEWVADGGIVFHSKVQFTAAELEGLAKESKQRAIQSLKK